MSEQRIPLNGGMVTSRHSSSLDPGEMTVADGVYLAPGDTSSVTTMPTRSEFDDTGSGAKVKGLVLAQFDSGGTDYLVALSGTDLYTATPGATGTFAAQGLSLSSSALGLIGAHMDNRWYLVTGGDATRRLKSDGTIGLAGLTAPDTALTVSSSGASSTVTRPATGTTFTNTGNARDSGTDFINTFAHASRTTAGSTTDTWTWAAPPGAGQLSVVWQLAGAQTDSDYNRPIGIGGRADAGFRVRVLITCSVDGGAAQTLVDQNGLAAAMSQSQTVQFAVTPGSVSLSVTATLTYTSGTSQATLRIYDIKHATAGSTVTPFDFETGVYYAYTEFDDVNGLESPPSPVTSLVTGSSIRAISLTTAARKNPAATHFKLYRTPDGGAQPSQLGGDWKIPIVGGAAATIIDDFVKWPATEQPLPLIRLLSVTSGRSGEGELFFALDQPPPTLQHINAFKGSLVGVTPNGDVAYSEAGLPESWPEINVLPRATMPLPEHDVPIGTLTVGDTLLIPCNGAMLTANELPRVIDGQFNASQISALRGQPGCVGIYAFCQFSVQGEAQAAWVSRFGVHTTNGFNSQRISNDLAWSSTVSTANLSTAVLHWNAEKLLLELTCDTNGDTVNDTTFLFHMSPEHTKSTGPKITRIAATALASKASGQVAGIWREYGGHVSNGIVYLEQATGAETVTLTTGTVYASYRDMEIFKGNLRHTDIASQSCTVTTTLTRDSSGNSQAVAKTVLLDSDKGTEFYVGRAGEKMSATISYTGGVAGRFIDIRYLVTGQGMTGRVA